MSAAAAAVAACAVIVNRCPLPDPFQPVALSVEPPKVAQDVLNGTLTEACRVTTIETCKNEAFKRAEILNPDCFLVLDIGPGEAAEFAEGCENIQEANKLFSREVAKICDVSESEAGR